MVETVSAFIPQTAWGQMFSDDDKNYLRRLVGGALSAAVAGENFAPVKPAGAALTQSGGCFVTYKTGGELRGCLGCFTSDQPLYLTVAAYANLSATADPRFAGNRLRPADLSRVEFEVSVLSPLTPCAAPEKIGLGRDGIYVRGDGRSGCFLPQVATETGWSVAEFWGNCCAGKAGLPADFWRSPHAELFTFTAEIITGKVKS
ncbi:AmmeMemoRadiSam system protein A [Planctomycetales bacterium]|nr:AmmeMemoRadiSam system protein A [Planctomycetales bacterium]GHS99978.1 AmmeMemoRadiSam system protein A [Planctomycetales bacterium]GHT06464.1 AmmeMemoRadiSam system protein A [Planctomycetales bacterium]